jgi:regulator of protease activity HflC (stomatin/prohibitin superfamily)
MTDQTRWGIDLVQVKNKAIKRQKDLVSRAMDQVMKMDESGITDLMIQIEKVYEEKYGEKIVNKVVL